MIKLFLVYTGLILLPQIPFIQVKGFPIESDVNKIINYWYNNGGGLDMIETMICENGAMNPKTVNSTYDYGLCQLNYKYNKQYINNPLRNSGYEYQAKVCLEKWLLVKNKNLRTCYKNRNKFYNSFIFPIK